MSQWQPQTINELQNTASGTLEFCWTRGTPSKIERQRRACLVLVRTVPYKLSLVRALFVAHAETTNRSSESVTSQGTTKDSWSCCWLHLETNPKWRPSETQTQMLPGRRATSPHNIASNIAACLGQLAQLSFRQFAFGDSASKQALAGTISCFSPAGRPFLLGKVTKVASGTPIFDTRFTHQLN